MAQKEMIQICPTSTHLPPGTPPSTPNLSSTEHVVTFSNAQKLFEMVKAIVDMEIASTSSKCKCPQRTSEAPEHAASTGPVTLKDVEALILKLIDEKSANPSAPDDELDNQYRLMEMVDSMIELRLASRTSVPQAPTQSLTIQDFKDLLKELVDGKQAGLAQVSDGPQPDTTDAQVAEADANDTNAFKTVEEVWDNKTYKYALVEPAKSTHEITTLDKYVFIVRRRVDKDTKETQFHIDIKSESLRDILRVILGDVQGISLKEPVLSVEQNLLHHYLPEIELYRGLKLYRDVEQSKIAEHESHLESLIDYIKTAYGPTRQSLNPILEDGHITFDLLWALFKSNTLVYTKCFGTGKPRCVKYDFGEERKTNSGVKYFHIEGRYLDFDGKVLGEAVIHLSIEKFRGAKRIDTLEVFPLHCHANESNARAQLLKCGHRFLGLTGIHHVEYHGKAFYMEKGRPIEVTIKGRIMVDPAHFRETNPNYKKPSISEPSKSSSNIWLSFDLDGTTVTSADVVKCIGKSSAEVAGDDVLLCSPTVLGFSLDRNLWLEFAVGDIEDIKWQPAALAHLQIPDKKKKAIQALSEAHMARSSDNRFDDFVAGKGQGLNVLLHGPPGVGKTLTAEVLSEHLQKPLYSVSAGELGTSAESVEARLPGIFQRASRWNALLLLDEADVYLEQRSPSEIIRNAIVCVFLRTLEYYQGIMFLTTNRVAHIDDAIASRIQFKINYNTLSADQRRSIWKGFLRKAFIGQGLPDYDGLDLENLVRRELNGRDV
ncbi:hypothetical protein GMDG_06869 [Pseudogymnoascus destructans 20631-21]|uniref:AAA+ ATPase domain-containing protein n=2 Tax=Pseudogymnoascus destructans TaxID=655981 RepID=L8FUQ9_PSED2|nr:hypothetical protein GMDG_06869 [Pseudogymnoascus destructans 20631-21]